MIIHHLLVPHTWLHKLQLRFKRVEHIRAGELPEKGAGDLPEIRAGELREKEAGELPEIANIAKSCCL